MDCDYVGCDNVNGMTQEEFEEYLIEKIKRAEEQIKNREYSDAREFMKEMKKKYGF